MADSRTAQPAGAAAHSPLDHRIGGWPAALLALALLARPPAAQALGSEFYIGLATRILVFALAATSLNLVLGFGGMVSFGHAAFLGLGAYAAALAVQAGVGSAWLVWPLAMAVAALAAFIIGAINAGIVSAGINAFYTQLAFGLVIVVSVVLQTVIERRIRRQSLTGR